jgi:hypothetical protein
MQLSSANSGARYGGYMTMQFPKDHPAWSPGWEGEYQKDPRIVVTSPVIRKDFATLEDAIAAARRVSAGAKDAVAVVRDPGTNGPWHVDRLLVHHWDEDRYASVDLEGVTMSRPSKDHLAIWQPLQSQRQVIMGAIVDGDLVFDNVGRYTSSRPDLPGRDPDKGAG